MFEISGKQRFRYRSPGNIIWVSWDLGAFRRMVSNIMTNALKYGAPSEPIVVSIESAPGERVLIRIQTALKGAPLSDADLDVIFSEHQRLHRGDEKGWGLGLTSVKQLAEQHHGTISCSSSREQGTTFTLDLPTHPETFRAANAA